MIHHNSSAAYSTEQVKLADDLFVVPFQNTIELQNTEQGISNVEVVEVGSATVPTWTKRAPVFAKASPRHAVARTTSVFS